MRVLDLVFAARPMLLIPVWTVYLVSLHYHHRLSGESFDWADLGMLAALTLAFAGAYYINQVYDIESDRINNKLGFLQRGLLAPGNLSLGFVITSTVALAISIAYSFWMLGIFAQIVFLGWAYSAPPLRLKDRPIGGVLANAWAIGFLIVFTVLPSPTIHTIGLLGWDNPVYFFFAVASITILTTIPDREGDRHTGKRTAAVALGTRGALALALVLMIIAVLVAWRSEYAALVYLALFASIVVLMALLLPAPGVVLLATKLPLLLMTLLAAFFYPGYLVFLVALILATRIYYQRRFGLVYPRLS
ncbi:hypothetical protein GF420_06205 [candidate division GN15 bacterium]|nr:hypothetical protein [candidate division GN15 bacterium]